MYWVSCPSRRGLLLPALALLGYYQGGQRTLVAVQDPAWRAHSVSEHVGSPAQNAVLLDERTRTLAFLAVALAAKVTARAFRQWRERRVGSIRLTYPLPERSAYPAASAC